MSGDKKLRFGDRVFNEVRMADETHIHVTIEFEEEDEPSMKTTRTK